MTRDIIKCNTVLGEALTEHRRVLSLHVLRGSGVLDCQESFTGQVTLDQENSAGDRQWK